MTWGGIGGAPTTFSSSPRPPVHRSARGHLVEDNYLSTAVAGITVAQYRRIASLPGVGVAAPLEIVGYVLETVTIPIDVGPAVGRSGALVLTVTSRFTADHGLSTYPSQEEGYVYVTPDPLTPLELRKIVGPVERLPDGKRVTVCPAELGANAGSSQSSPFDSTTGLLNGSCYSRQGSRPDLAYVKWSFPVLIGAIDPAAENELTGLRRAMSSGRYLREAERPRSIAQGGSAPTVIVPVLASTVSFDGDVDHLTVSILPKTAAAVARSQRPLRIAKALAMAKATPVMHVTVTGTQAWQALLGQLAQRSTVTSGRFETSFAEIVGQYWTSSQVTYRHSDGGALEVVPRTNPDSVWQSGVNVTVRAYVSAPPAAADIGFRSLTEHLPAPRALVDYSDPDRGRIRPVQAQRVLGRTGIVARQLPALRY